ncbi:hypothetical protein [Streptomyces sp. NPDC058398]|uniref:hypothetical protein n=1 Tax=Streptomyces sp. NPDC058398 TaxID=3346479 RepID=UPI00364B950F
MNRIARIAIAAAALTAFSAAGTTAASAIDWPATAKTATAVQADGIDWPVAPAALQTTGNNECRGAAPAPTG